MTILILILSIISAVFYRSGGLSPDSQEKYSKWIPKWLRHSWVRDWLCPICCLIPIALVNPSWWLLLAYLLSAASLSTYWDFMFGFDNYWFSGFMLGVSFFPLLFLGYAWWIILIRAIALAILWGGICAATTDADIEEYSRGFTLSAATLILFA